MPGPEVRSFRRPSWEPVPYEGCVNVEGRVIFWDDTLGLAMLRFGRNGTIHEHAGERDAIVSCLEGRGYTSVGGEVAPLVSGEMVHWPAGVPHRLWTDDSTMVTLMCERPPA